MFGVLLIHSFGSTPKEFEKFSDYLEDQGFYTNTPLLSGHGTMPSDLRGISYDDWINDVQQGYSELQQRCQGVFVAGQTTGVSLALNLAASNPGILGLVSLSGVFKISRWQHLIRPIFHLFPEDVPFASKDSRLITQFHAEWERVNAYTTVPNKSLLEVYKLLKVTFQKLSKIVQPILVLHSTNNINMDKDNPDLIFKSVSSKKKKLVFLDAGGGLMTVGAAKEMVFKEVSDFLWSCIHLYQM